MYKENWHSPSYNTAYTLRATPCPSGHCSLRSQRRICWKRYTESRLIDEEVI